MTNQIEFVQLEMVSNSPDVLKAIQVMVTHTWKLEQRNHIKYLVLKTSLVKFTFCYVT
jgi:hypothetical protein